MNALLTLSLAVFVYLLLGAVLSMAAYLGLRAFRRVLEQQSPERRATLYAAAVLVPPVVVALVAAASFGRPEGSHHWTEHIDPSWFACLAHFRVCSFVVGGSVALAAAVLCVALRRTVTALAATVQKHATT